MFTSDVEKSLSEHRIYTVKPGDEFLHNGFDDNTFSFIEYGKYLAQVNNDQEWEFNLHNSANINGNPEFIQYKQKWSEKWDMVKEILCGPDFFDCKVVKDILKTHYQNRY